MNLTICLINYDHLNESIDCYSKSPVDKFSLLEMLKKEFGLNYLIEKSVVGLNATGPKDNYFSTNYKARKFGYEPINTSEETILKESKLIFKKLSS